jgi:hypothetical protein
MGEVEEDRGRRELDTDESGEGPDPVPLVRC